MAICVCQKPEGGGNCDGFNLIDHKICFQERTFLPLRLYIPLYVRLITLNCRGAPTVKGNLTYYGKGVCAKCN